MGTCLRTDTASMLVPISWACLLVISFTSGCTPKSLDAARGGDPSVSLPAIGKDEVARINGKPLTLTTFLTLRRSHPGLSDDQILWLGLGALALRDKLLKDGYDLTSEEHLNIARYATGLIQERPKRGPQYVIGEATAVRGEINRLLEASTLEKNDFVLKNLPSPAPMAAPSQT